MEIKKKTNATTSVSELQRLGLEVKKKILSLLPRHTEKFFYKLQEVLAWIILSKKYFLKLAVPIIVMKVGHS